MTLNGTISNHLVGLVFLVAFAVGSNWIERRRNPRPPWSRYRKDGGIPLVAFWNMFDESKFTPEAIEFHRRRLLAIPVLLAVFALGWLILDLIW
jgi:hypothetical protein